MLWIILLFISSYLFYRVFITPLTYWKRRNVPYSKPLPIVGNFLNVALKRRNIYDVVIDLYKEFPNQRYNGIQVFNTPMLLIRDLNLVKRITIKDFEHFVDHRQDIEKSIDPIFSQNLFLLKGQKWREMRATLSPAFTTSKMKLMYEFMCKCSEQLVDHFLKFNAETVEVELKDVFRRFGNDVIASAAFGIEVDSFEEPDNEFYRMGMEMFDETGIRGVKMMAMQFCPSLFKIFRMQMFPGPSRFFHKIVMDSVKLRKEKGIVRPDMIHLLMEAQRGKLRYEESDGVDTGFATVKESDLIRNNSKSSRLKDEDLTGQALIFFMAGFEGASTVMGFMAHELALNDEIQEKLSNEIDETYLDSGGKVTYEVLMKMKYLDMVVSETLRKWSPGTSIDRICVKDFLIEPQNPGEEEVLVEKGSCVFIPLAAFHYDEKYFPRPEKFDPERFNDENRKNIVPYSYMPFSIGPRNCIGSRFALLEIKVLMFHLLKNFKLVVIDRTQIPLKLTPKKVLINPERGFWLGLKKR